MPRKRWKGKRAGGVDTEGDGAGPNDNYGQQRRKFSGGADEENEAMQASKTAEVILSGEKLYKQDCAVCHGNDLKGNGPAQPPFKDVPPDLTTLAKRHRGKFPEKYFDDVLRNGVVIPAHGTPEMPTWGADFRIREHLSSTQVTQRIANLSNFIKSLQEK